MPIKSALREHWPEYLIEAWALSCLMISIGLFASALGSPKSPMYAAVPNAAIRTVLLALAIGATLALIIQSPWGKRSGAHMNPAITLAFLRVGKAHPWDGLFFILAQTAGGILGVSAVALFVGTLFTDPPVRYAVTTPGPAGAGIALVAETMISFALMAAILVFTASIHLIRFTSLAAGCVVALFIIVEAPLSGASAYSQSHYPA
jgi:aquaporin Z